MELRCSEWPLFPFFDRGGHQIVVPKGLRYLRTDRKRTFRPAALYEHLKDLFGLVRFAKLVRSTDSHDALRRRVRLAFFPTHHPEWRVCDYPKCRAVMPRSYAGSEFTREPPDDELAYAAWIPNGGNLGWLTDVFTRDAGAICTPACLNTASHPPLWLQAHALIPIPWR